MHNKDTTLSSLTACPNWIASLTLLATHHPARLGTIQRCPIESQDYEKGGIYSPNSHPTLPSAAPPVEDTNGSPDIMKIISQVSLPI